MAAHRERGLSGGLPGPRLQQRMNYLPSARSDLSRCSTEPLTLLREVGLRAEVRGQPVLDEGTFFPRFKNQHPDLFLLQTDFQLPTATATILPS